MCARCSCKYEILIIIGLCFIFLCFHFEKRFLKGLTIAALLFVLLLVPHVLWLLNHAENPISYAMSRSSHKYSIITLVDAVIFQPLYFSVGFLFIFFSIFFKILTRRRKIVFYTKSMLLHPLVFFAFSPWAVFCILSTFLSTQGEWSYPLFVLWIPAIFLCLNLKCSKLLPILTYTCVLQFIALVVYLSINFIQPRMSRINYPSYSLSNAAKQFANSHDSGSSLSYVGGDTNIAYYLAAYLPNRPVFLRDNSFKSSPWASKVDFSNKGAVFVSTGCNHSHIKYNQLGFRVVSSRCLYLLESNKLHPSYIPITLYLIG